MLVVVPMYCLSVSFGLVAADGVVCPLTTSVCSIPLVIDHKSLGVSIFWLQLWQLSTWASEMRSDSQSASSVLHTSISLTSEMISYFTLINV
jgi:hypothetical protein